MNILNNLPRGAPNFVCLIKFAMHVLHERPLSPPSVKLPVKNLLPGSEIELSIGYGYHDFPSHDLPLEVGIPVILPSPVVAVLGSRLMGGHSFSSHSS